MAEGQQATRELSSHSLAGTQCSPHQFVALAPPSAPRCCWQHQFSPPLTQGISFPGRGSAPGCSFTCDNQDDLTGRLRTQPPACPKRRLSLPHRTVNLHQAEALVHLFSHPSSDCFPPSPESLCPVLGTQCTGAQWSERSLLRSISPGCSQLLQPVPHQADTPSFHIVFKGIRPPCYPMCTHTAA